uniref:Uncharacterized protein n=1 Tax=Mustela putorius furo TaxID=9669 RepID=M3YGV2_MUSPF
MKPGSASHRIPTRPPGCWSLPEAFPPFSSTALPQVPEHPPRHPSRRDVARVPDRYSRCPSPPPPPPAGCPVGDSPAGQVGAPGGSRLWGRLQLPQGWADTGALHTAGGDTSPPHNSWQPGERRPPSCRRRSARSGDGRRRHRHRRSCLLCRCSSCYCGEGGSSAAAGSARGAGSGGGGGLENDRERFNFTSAYSLFHVAFSISLTLYTFVLHPGFLGPQRSQKG